MKIQRTVYFQVIFWPLVPLVTTFLLWVFQFTGFSGMLEAQSYAAVWKSTLDFNLAFLLIGAASFYFTYFMPFRPGSGGFFAGNLMKLMICLLLLLFLPVIILLVLSNFIISIALLFRYALYFGYFAEIIFVVAALALRYLRNWIRSEKALVLAQNHTTSVELNLLKSQLSPHFLFNTINNIDSLITTDPPRASAYLNELAEILRFMLYHTKKGVIKLTDELLYIEKYVMLQRIRSDNEHYVRFEVQGEPGGWEVAPFLFIPIIENAFKHCSDKSRDSSIDIRFDIQETQIVFFCRNLYLPAAMVEEQSGIGVNLIRRRLELLYADLYELDIVQDLTHYQVKLKLYPHAN